MMPHGTLRRLVAPGLVGSMIACGADGAEIYRVPVPQGVERLQTVHDRTADDVLVYEPDRVTPNHRVGGPTVADRLLSHRVVYGLPDAAPVHARDRVVEYGVVGRPVPRACGIRRSGEGGFDGLIARAARAYRVEPSLIRAMVAVESNFDPNALSPKGAQGLMQLMPMTARDMGVRCPFDPEDNVFGGVRYMRLMLDRYGDVSLALAAYNAGPEAVDRHGGIPAYPETQVYVERVLDHLIPERN